MSASFTKKLIVAAALAFTLQGSKKMLTLANEVAINNNSIWQEAGRIVGFIFNKCLPSDFKGRNQLHRHDNAAVILEDCLKRRGLRALDRALSRDVIEITDNIVLVKWKNDTANDDQNNRAWKQQKWKTLKPYKALASWESEIIQRIAYLLKTRLIKITFKGFNHSSIQSEARHRNKNNNALGQMMMFGLVAAGFIVIPLGFQFLAVLGGKALLLAKLALLLTSIQGLKKIATSEVNYGLYSTGHGGHGGHGGGPWHYDRHWHHEADPYSSSLYSSAHSSPISDYYAQSSNYHPSGYSGFNPRAEDHLAS